MIVRLRNFMSHDASTFDLPSSGLVVITGPNGAGKSALVEAVAAAMWGRSARSARWSPWRADLAGSVELDDGDLRVRRKWTGKSKSLAWGRGGVEKFDTTSKAQDGLDAAVGPFEVWRRTCVFSAADAAHFTMSTDAERKQLLEELLGLTWFDRALQLCREELVRARTYHGQAVHQAVAARGRAEEVERALTRDMATLAASVPPARVPLAAADLARLSGLVADARRDMAEVDARRAELEATGGARLERARQLRHRLERLRLGTCSACGQSIPPELGVRLEAEIAALTTEAEASRASVEGEVRKAVSELEELRAELAELLAQHAAITASSRAVGQARQLHERLVASVEEGRGKLDELRATVTNSEAQAARCAVDVAELEACERILGTRGARAHLMGKTLSSIEALANAMLARLGSEIVVGLSPSTERKSGAVVDAISLTLSGAGGESGYAGASAGERRRVDVAILMALAELARGAQSSTWVSPLFFDEVFDSLDVAGRQAVLEVLGELAATRCVVLITHEDSLTAAGAARRYRVDGGVVT